MTLKVDWKDCDEELPASSHPAWVKTCDGSIALAWYLRGKNSGFYPYPFIAIEVNPNPFMKYGRLTVSEWAYAELPEHIYD